MERSCMPRCHAGCGLWALRGLSQVVAPSAPHALHPVQQLGGSSLFSASGGFILRCSSQHITKVSFLTWDHSFRWCSSLSRSYTYFEVLALSLQPLVTEMNHMRVLSSRSSG